jgi:glutathione S-transferase
MMKVKGLHYEKRDGDLALVTKHLTLRSKGMILNYLDEKYPSPQLICGDVDNRTRLRLLYDHIKNNPLLSTALAREASPFIFGEQITIIDLLVAEYSEYEPFNKFIRSVINEQPTAWDHI